MNSSLFKMVFPEPPPAKRLFEPSPQPPPPRVLSDRPIRGQEQSVFLTKLPAEVRNRIYEFAFEGRGTLEDNEEQQEEEEIPSGERGDKSSSLPEEAATNEGGCLEVESTPVPAAKQRHPLSLLLTCRQINLEATLLAFTHHNFTIRRKIHAFHDLRMQTALLSPGQIATITSLAYEVAQPYNAMPISRGSRFLASALVLFPAVTRLELRIERTRDEQGSNPHNPASGDRLKPACVMTWLWATLKEVLGGRFVGGWQAGQKWELEWPLMDEDIKLASEINQLYIDGESVFGPTARAMREAYLRNSGVDRCVCACRLPSWNRVWLVQETGRRVRVDVMYYGDWVMAREKARKMELLRHKVKLMPGAERLPVRSLSGEVAVAGEGVQEMRGFGWDGEERQDVGWGNWWRTLGSSGVETGEGGGERNVSARAR